MPENFVQAIANDGNNRLWIATTGGLSSFDGSRFMAPTGERLAGIAVNSFSSLKKAADGSLWAGTEGGGLLHLTGGKSELFDSKSGLSDLYVRSIFEDAQGRLWIGTDGGLFLKDGSRFRNIHFGSPGSPQDVHDIVEDAQHHILVGGSQLWKLGSPGTRMSRLPGTDSQSQIKSMLFSRDGVLWVGTPTGLFRYVNNRFERMLHSGVDALLQGHDGQVWVGTTGAGLMTIYAGKLSLVGNTSGPTRVVLSLAEDNDGRIWAGTESGLIRLQSTSVHIIPLPITGMEFGTVSNLPNGDVAIASQHVFELSHGSAREHTFKSLDGMYAINLLLGRDGSAWLGTLSNGLYHITPTRTDHYSTHSIQPLTGDAPRGLLETEQGDIWVATGFGLNRIRDGAVTQFGTAAGLPSRNIRSIIEDRSRCLWIGTEAGLAEMCGDTFIHNRITDDLRGEKIWAILQDRSGTFWFGTRDHGLYRFKNNTLLHLTAADGFFSNTIYSLLQDTSGTFWVSSPEKVVSIPEKEMERIEQNQSAPLAMTIYSMPQGAEGTQLAGGRFPSGCVARDNSIWLASDRGAVRIEHEINPIIQPPLATITEASVDGLPLSRNTEAHVQSPLRRVRFDYEPLFLGPLNEIQLMYRLQGLDTNWTSSPSSGTAQYGGLAPGHYRFDVKVFLRSNPGRVSTTSFAFVVEPVWYKTRHVLVLAVALLLLLAITAYIVRLRRLRARFKLILDERSRLAREMHDTVIQGCNGVSMLLEAVASNEGHSSNSELLMLARSQIQSTIGEAREAVWGLRTTSLEMKDFDMSLRHLATQAQDALGVSVRQERLGTIPPICAGVTHELMMIAREAVANAGNHAEPASILLRTSFTQNLFALEIIDDGCGFIVQDNMAKQNNHYGLIGMNERANKIHAKLSISSNLGRGTKILIEVPASQLSNGGK